jgi:hypothetical protein
VISVVPWKVAWVVIGFSLTLIAGGLPILLGLTPLITVPAAVVVAVAAGFFARQAVEFSDLFHGTTDSARSDITGLIILAITAHAAWIITFQLAPQWWMWWPAVLLAVSGIEYGSAWSYEYMAAAKARRKSRSDGARDADGNALDSTSQVMAHALKRAGLSTVVVDSWEELRDSDRHPG